MNPDAPDESERLMLAINESRRLLAESERILETRLGCAFVERGSRSGQRDPRSGAPDDRDNVDNSFES